MYTIAQYIHSVKAVVKLLTTNLDHLRRHHLWLCLTPMLSTTQQGGSDSDVASSSAEAIIEVKKQCWVGCKSCC